MAWTTPSTAVAGSTALTAAFWNEQVRDNLTALDAAGANAVGLVLVDRTDFTSSTSVVPSGAVFSSDYLTYRMMIYASSTTASQVSTFMRYRNGATSETGSVYAYAYVGIGSNNTAANSAADNQTSLFIGAASNQYAKTMLAMDVTNPLGANETVATVMNAYESSSDGYYYGRQGAGACHTNTSYDRFELTASIAITGTVMTYGYKGV